MKDYILKLDGEHGSESSVLYAKFPADTRALEFARHKLAEPPGPRAIEIWRDSVLVGRIEAPPPTAA